MAPARTYRPATDPFADAGVGWFVQPLALALVAAMVVGVLSLVVRYRRATAVQRYQLRWLAFAAVVGAVGVTASSIIDAMARDSWLVPIPGAIGTAALPVAVALAVFRRNLFDLDRVIGRTVSYLLLTGVLVGVYALGVLGVGALLPGERSDLSVAGATLIAAALFRPLRSRIQSAVDRRFNRSRYDAARTIEAFGARLRDEVALGSLSQELRLAVDATLRPRVASLWLREGGA